MDLARTGVNALAVFAMLLIVGSGFVASAAPSPLDQPGRSQGWQAPDAVGGGLSFILMPTPLYLHQPVPDNFPFKQGGAVAFVFGDKLEVKTSFQGSPGTTFSVVLQTADQNATVGRTTSGRDGQGQFQGNVTLSPGGYDVGLLIFAGGPSPVAVSVPRSLHIVLGGASQAETTSTAARGESGAGQQQAGGSSPAGQLQFVPVSPSAKGGYDFGTGNGDYAVVGANITFSLAFSGQRPGSVFSVVLAVNGTSTSLGNYTADSGGSGHFEATASLGTGTFSLGLEVVDLTGFAVPTPVLSSVPRPFTVEAVGPSTSGEAPPPGGLNATASPNGPVWTFSLQPAPGAAAPRGYRFAESGTALVSMGSEGSPTLGVALSIRGANPSTSYYADLVLNGTDLSLGSMTTNRLGDVVLRSSVQVSPGTYLLGVAIYGSSDAGEFNQSSPALVMVGAPSPQLAIVGQGASPGASASFSTPSSTSSASSTGAVTSSVTTESAGSEVEGQIQSALNFTIPAAVQVTPLNSYSNVYDSRFSLSVGQQGNNGLVIAISGENVTGPRVLLVNMSRTDPLALYPALSVTLDGAPVSEASSALQVLDPVATNPPYYVLIATSDSIQLLVSIPHFSLHLIQVAGVVVASAVSSLVVDAPLLLGSVLVVTLVFAAVYGARKRYTTAW
ncbi:MAG: hypothetical protein JRN23_04010 [Nitrososphaerota archaeon]|nr:hypothetical protein [Nitrososphaerota archaeon]MDG6978542.1 hypothetical protein [Nitrososphaerota archaeon]MDG7021076.1 hypothetical protein [Nitrososphaerota archaeon]MDG7022022.1 hypothetical protein [Nitrososphaerota archaeon]